MLSDQPHKLSNQMIGHACGLGRMFAQALCWCGADPWMNNLWILLPPQ